MKDDNWLFRQILHFLEYDLKNKKRFSKMEGGEFAHALMMVYGAYLLNSEKTGNNTINVGVE
jgi:hypothetical protein